MGFALLRHAWGALALACVATAQTTWYVDAQGSPPGSGTRADPYTSIRYAISAAGTVDGDTLLVLPGVYRESIDFAGKSIAIVGVEGPDHTRLEAISNTPVVSLRSGEGAGTCLEGVTLTGGHGIRHGASGASCGGGVFAIGAHLEMLACILEANSADRGAGLYLESSVVTVSDSAVRDNHGCGIRAVGSTIDLLRLLVAGHEDYGCPFGGGGMSLDSCTTTLRESRVSGNRSQGDGGGVLANGGTLVVSDTDFVENVSAGNRGGALASFAKVTIERCRFLRNVEYDDHEGGAIFAELGGSLIASDCLFRENLGRNGGAASGGFYERCTFVGNQCYPSLNSTFGGALYRATAVRSIFIDNGTSDGGPARGNATSESTLRFCSLWENRGFAPEACHDSDLSHCILWSNGATPIGGDSSVEWSLVEGGWPGSGNFSADPLFWFPEAEDLHLRPGSPAIDAGDPNGELDLDGTRADLGAFPHDPAYCGEPGSYCSAKTSSLGCTPSIHSEGSPSLTGADDFHLRGESLLGDQWSMLVWSTGGQEVPFYGGTLCVAPPLVRGPLQKSSGAAGTCEGTVSFHFSQAYMAGYLLAPFTAVHAQYWFRDPGAPEPVGLTGGLCFVLSP